MAQPVVKPTSGIGPLAADQALSIAQADATNAYRDLTKYHIHVVFEADGWHVDYELKNARMKGGGPHYVIDPASGHIVSKRYDQ
jgi:hypothetical protein